MKRILRYVSLFLVILGSIVLMAGCGNTVGHEVGQKEAQKPAAPQTESVKLVVPKGIPVLMYHKLGYEKDNDAVLAPKNFEEQMKLLHDKGYHTLTMEQLYAYVTEGKAVPVKPVVITFDDGYKDTYTIAYPILKKYNFHATLFINPSNIGERLTWDELKEMQAGGMTISNHSYYHKHLAQMSPEEALMNISKGQEILNAQMGIENPWFCYPYGSYNKVVIGYVQDQGMKMAMAMSPGWAHKGDNPYKIDRVWIGNPVDIKHFEQRITTEHYEDL